MKRSFLITIGMGLFLIPQSTRPLSPQHAAIAAGLTTLGLATGSYYIFKKHYKMDTLESIGLTAAVTAPLGYLASVLWFGLTPEMRYVSARNTVENNKSHGYALQAYQSIDGLLKDVETQYSSYAWLVDLHDDMVRALTKTRCAMKKWSLAQHEESVDQFSWVDKSTYQQLEKQAACLEHNLFLLRHYRPFQTQHNAWLVAHNCGYSYRY